MRGAKARLLAGLVVLVLVGTGLLVMVPGTTCRAPGSVVGLERSDAVVQAKAARKQAKLDGTYQKPKKSRRPG